MILTALNEQGYHLTDCPKLRGHLFDAWNMYHDSLQNNQDEVISTIYNSFRQTFRNITPLNLNGTVKLFCDLGRNDLAEDIIKYYVENRVENYEFWDLDKYTFSNDISEQGVIQAFAEKLASFKIENDPFSILFKIGNDRSWDNHDIATLASLPLEVAPLGWTEFSIS